LREPTAIVFADQRGFKGYGRGLIPLAGKPMIEYVLDSIPDEVTDILIAVREEEKEAYSELAEKHWARVITSESAGKSERSRVEFAVKVASGESVVILPCDTPLLTREFTNFLVEASQRFTAVLPRTPTREVAYWLASYQTRPFAKAFEENPEDSMDSLVKKVGRVLYLSSNSLKIFDERLAMFFRVSRPADIRRAERYLRKRLV